MYHVPFARFGFGSGRRITRFETMSGCKLLLRNSSRLTIIIYRIFPGKPVWRKHGKPNLLDLFHPYPLLSSRNDWIISDESLKSEDGNNSHKSPIPKLTRMKMMTWERWIVDVTCATFFGLNAAALSKTANNVFRWRRNFHTCSLLNVQNTINNEDERLQYPSPPPTGDSPLREVDWSTEKKITRRRKKLKEPPVKSYNSSIRRRLFFK